MRRVMLALAALIVVAVGLWLAMGRSPRSTSAQASPEVASTASAERGRPAPIEDGSVADRAQDDRVKAREARAALRERILAAERRREQAATASTSGATDGDAAEPAAETDGTPPSQAPVDEDAEAPSPPEPEPRPGNLVDRTGRRNDLTKVMNEDLMPLVDECYALALDTTPGLAGMFVIEFELLGDEELGGVIESVRPAPDNELDDPELIECIRESILATTLPPPDQSGREGVALSLRLSPDE